VRHPEWADSESSRGGLKTLMDQQVTHRLTMSVIVCTLDRAHVLEAICLGSLAAQEQPGRVELIVCDASSDTATADAVREWGRAHPDWPCTYVQATRRGSCSQRNQSVRVARGDILLFLDDDLELLPGALVALAQAFDRDAACQYGGLECMRVLPVDAERPELDLAKRPHPWFVSLFGLQTEWGPKRILPGGFNTGGGPVDRETASALRREEGRIVDVEWMSGCCMAFRAGVFRDGGIRFDERLERFGGYALAEDVVVSLAVRRTIGLRLGRCSSAQAVHWEAPGGRGDDRSRWAARAYNHRIVWALSGAPTMARRLSWLRSQVGSVIQCLRHRRMDWLRGLADGWRAIRLDETSRASASVSRTRRGD
jgi:glycosyltransferase involved in cell wall biosynthesis